MDQNWLSNEAVKLFCAHGLQIFCDALVRIFSNDNPTLNDDDRFAVYAAH